MKLLKYFLVTVGIVVILYGAAVMLGFNVPKPWEKGIVGDAELRVTLLMDNNVRNPLANIEVDVAEKPGQPPKGGVAITDQNGTATFMVKPGTYFIYFNDLSFPKNLAIPELRQVTVDVEQPGKETILVTTRK